MKTPKFFSTLFIIFLIGVAGANPASNNSQLVANPTVSNGTLVLVYNTTDVELIKEITHSRKWKYFFLACEETAWAAYYAGREAHAVDQLNELYERMGWPSPKILLEQ